MIIKSLRVRNFRCIKDETLPCDRLTAIVGPNGSGKSTFLRSLELFYTPVARYAEEDFFGGDTAQPIRVTVTYANLTAKERILFDKYLQGNDLTVEKVMILPCVKASQKYHGTSLRNPEFADFRAASSATDRKQCYNVLRGKAKYALLPVWSRQEEAVKNLSEWEADNAAECTREVDDGQFFGFTEVGQAHLERYTYFLLIPAVRDAIGDAAEGRGAVLSQLMDLVVRSVLLQRQELVQLRQDVQQRYEQIVDPANLPELQLLADELSTTLKGYAPGAQVDLSWIRGEGISINLPQAMIRLVEDGYASSVHRTGHGLQRSFILTMLQHLASAQYRASQSQLTEAGTRPGAGAVIQLPNLILAIEEPELYLHPNRQRHLSRILYEMASGAIPGVAEMTQVLYTTHSPLFVGIERFDQIRRLRKTQTDTGVPKETKVSHATLDVVAGVVGEADGQPAGTYTGEALRPRLQALMTPWMNEGFFADVVVLVEGEEDRAAIHGVAGNLTVANGQTIDLESLGISVIPCIGKNNLDRPTAIFQAFGIPVYTIWDSDCGTGNEHDQNNSKRTNHRLLRLCGVQTEDWPEIVSARHSCFKEKLEKTLRNEIGENPFNRLVQKWAEMFDYDRADAIKSPQVMRAVVLDAQNEGLVSPTLVAIVRAIMALKG